MLNALLFDDCEMLCFILVQNKYNFIGDNVTSLKFKDQHEQQL